jgi:hypothetical protein
MSALGKEARTVADFPDLLRDWHSEKNGDLAPEQFSLGSNRRIWWTCAVATDHIWAAPIANRTRGAGCPFCANQRVARSNSLATLSPAVARQWHPTRNRPLMPSEVTPGSGRKVWWVCPEVTRHEWRAAVVRRTQGQGCPFCAGRREPGQPATALRRASLARRTKLLREWHPTKNGTLAPRNLSAGSGRKVWWLCLGSPDHEWEAPVSARTKGNGCPFCAGKRVSRAASLASLSPVLAKQWHSIRNGDLTPHDVSPGSNRTVWWRCRVDPAHEWKAVIHERSKSSLACPFCVGRRTAAGNSLADERPDVAREWHPTKNEKLTARQVRPGSTQMVWWRCARDPDHCWKARVYARTTGGADGTGAGCPFCTGRRLSFERSLAVLNSEIADEWHPTKNGALTPYDVFPSSRQAVWWSCPKGPDHVWRARTNSRVYSSGALKSRCVFCAGQRVSVTNSLATKFPAISAQWYRSRNGRLTPEKVVAGSQRRVWWKCPEGPDHKWQTAVVKRTNPSGRPAGCPFCLNKRVSVTNALSTRAPAIAAEWHPVRNGRVKPEQVVYGSDFKAWWRCAKGHVWLAKVTDRVKKGSGCPACKPRKRRPVMTHRRPRLRVYLPSDLS